jgi:hypothetical protein
MKKGALNLKNLLRRKRISTCEHGIHEIFHGGGMDISKLVANCTVSRPETKSRFFIMKRICSSLSNTTILLLLLAASSWSPKGDATSASSFRRIATFKICRKFDANCNDDTETVAEIVDATPDGKMLVYTDSKVQEIGLVDISDPSNPVHVGRIATAGEPTSVSVTNDGKYAVAAVNTSPDFVNVQGLFIVIEISSRTIVATLNLPGQPDCIKVAPSHARIAVVIENERNEDLGEGEPPQLPAGSLVLINTTPSNDPTAWTIVSVVSLTGLANVAFPQDPEPEYVDIDDNGMAIVSLQENNGLVLVNVMDGSIVSSGTAGTVNLDQVDAQEDNVVSQSETLLNIPREPDTVAWLGTSGYFATADEGDLFGGSRGFTIYDNRLNVVFTAGNALEHWVARIGHYNEDRSENKGNEPEGVAFGKFDGIDMLFVLSERSNVCFVYNVRDPTAPKLLQILPTGVGPESVKAIPSRNLLVVASEIDSRADKTRAGITIYDYTKSSSSEQPIYPTIISADRADGSPIPFAALSGLACGGEYGHLLIVRCSILCITLTPFFFPC